MGKKRSGNDCNRKNRRSKRFRDIEEQTNYTFFYLFKQFITKNCSQKEARIILPYLLATVLVIVAIITIINITRGNPEKIWEKAQITQRDNSFMIEGERKWTIVRKNDNVDWSVEKVRFYSDKGKWRSDKEEMRGPNIISDEHMVFISVYDGRELHDYVNIEDKNHIGEYEPTELSVNKGMIIYQQEKNAGREQPLEDIIADFNSMHDVVNWYKYRYAYGVEHPKITGKKVINNYECINIKFSSSREVCVSEDYGIAIYWKNSTDESSGIFGDVNKESIIEYTVSKVKNSELDKVRIDRSLFDLPDVKPWHVYGEY